MLDPAIALDLMNIISETYTDRVKSIVSAETRPAPGFEGDDIFIVARDGRKQLAIRLNETRLGNDQIAIKLLNPNEIDPGASDYAEGEELSDEEWNKLSAIDSVAIADALATMAQSDE